MATGASRSRGPDEAVDSPALAVQRQARALGDPTRHRIFRYVADSAAPVEIAALTAHLGLHHNAIRQHVAKLVDAGLLLEETAPAAGRGRPPRRYRLSPVAESRWGVTGPYERLSWWLAEVVRSGDPPREVGRRVGRRATLDVESGADPAERLGEEMARHGFDPALYRAGDRLELVLRTCPFPSAARADPETVCQLHLGLAEGIAEALDGLEVDALVPQDPRDGHCELRCHLDPGGEGRSASP